MGALRSRGPDELNKKKEIRSSCSLSKIEILDCLQLASKYQIRNMHARGSVLCAFDSSSENNLNKKKNDPLAALYKKLHP